MCGFVGAIARAGRQPGLSDRGLDVWCDAVAHRGPDGAASWRGGQVALGHRRLAIRDLSEAGAQPMHAPQGRGVLVYNGELYNDAELRAELGPYAAGFGGFATACDAETVLFAMMCWGEAAVSRLRGIFALAWIDNRERHALLARDPLGVKPLYWAGFGGELTFASEVAALLKHPAARAEPDLAMVSAYLTTVRRELGDRTMFKGVFSVLPGETLRVDLDDAALRPVLVSRW
ncbi:MAG: asparagine synthetase B, partial [Nannocystaceae bacterium]|nr:asparagine synthetase B [Nannocystaceae bacterium]